MCQTQIHEESFQIIGVESCRVSEVIFSLLTYIHCRTRTLILIRVWTSIPKMGTVMIGDKDPDRNLSPSLCHVNSFCTVQCVHVWQCK